MTRQKFLASFTMHKKYKPSQCELTAKFLKFMEQNFEEECTPFLANYNDKKPGRKDSLEPTDNELEISGELENSTEVEEKGKPGIEVNLSSNGIERLSIEEQDIYRSYGSNNLFIKVLTITFLVN